MTHLKGQQDDDLHHEDGTHRSTPASTKGVTELVSFHRRMSEHIAIHHLLHGEVFFTVKRKQS